MAGADERTTTPEPRSPGEAAEAEEAGTRSSRASSRRSTASRSTTEAGAGAGFPELESTAFRPGEDPGPRQPAADVDEFELEPPEPIVWTPERAGFLLRGAGFALHAADGASSHEGGEDLWRMTEADLEAMGPPLAAILNRYEAARRLAGLSEEGALAFGLAAYAKRNLATRGRVMARAKALEEGTVEEPPAFAHSEPPADAWREGEQPRRRPLGGAFGDPDPPPAT